ncbi:MAG: hypothetical protein OXT67_11860 [Zetaproteobacteria bacterium]|nr:hypothetical protein [Zetaproteobacteria bacterium]
MRHVRFYILGLLLSHTACLQPKRTAKISGTHSETSSATLPEEPSPTTEVTSPASSTSEQPSPQPAETVLEADLLLLPEMARVAVHSQVVYAPSMLVEGHFAPSFSIQYTRADYVEILRCQADYTFTTLDGKNIRQQRAGIRTEDLFDAWQSATGAQQQCKSVAAAFAGETFYDDIATVGHYFYALNPCISTPRSILGKAGCSYQLQFTQSVEVLHSLSQKMRQKRQELGRAEADLNLALSNARILSYRIVAALEACETQVANDKTKLAFVKGLIQLGTFIVGSIAGAIFPGNFMGPLNGALMVGGMATQMATQMWLFPDVFKLQDQVKNECIDPYVVETTQATRDRLAQDEKTRDAADNRNDSKTRGQYEEEFQVQNMLSAFRAHLEQGGTLHKAVEQVKQEMAELHQLNKCVRDWNQVSQQLRTAGLDPDNLTLADSDKIQALIRDTPDITRQKLYDEECKIKE